MKLPINAWSFLYWIFSLIRCAGSSILVLVVVLGMHVEEVTFAAFVAALDVNFAAGDAPVESGSGLEFC